MGQSQCCEPLEVQMSLFPFLTLGIGLVSAVGRRQQLWKGAQSVFNFFFLSSNEPYPDFSSRYHAKPVVIPYYVIKYCIIYLTSIICHYFTQHPVYAHAPIFGGPTVYILQYTTCSCIQKVFLMPFELITTTNTYILTPWHQSQENHKATSYQWICYRDNLTLRHQLKILV